MFTEVKTYLQRLPEEVKEFWSPVSVAIGVTSVLYSLNISLDSITFGGWVGVFDLIFGLAFIVMGVLIKPHLNWKLITRIGMTSGLSIFLFGTRLLNNKLFWGWIIVIISAVLVLGSVIKAQAEFKQKFQVNKKPL